MNAAHSTDGVPALLIVFFLIAAFFVVMSVIRTRRPSRGGARQCHECRTACPPHANFCPNCGTRVAHL